MNSGRGKTVDIDLIMDNPDVVQLYLKRLCRFCDLMQTIRDENDAREHPQN